MGTGELLGQSDGVTECWETRQAALEGVVNPPSRLMRQTRELSAKSYEPVELIRLKRRVLVLNQSCFLSFFM